MRRTTSAVLVSSVALATDMLVYGLIVPILPTLAAQHGASPATVGALFAAYAAALIIATPFVGLWVDRAGSRRPMLVGMIGLAAATLLFATSPWFELLLVARALQGVSAAVSWTAGLALIAATHPPNRRGSAMGIALASVSIGVLLGPPLGGFLFEHWGLRAPFFLAAGLAAFDAVLRAVLVRDLPASGQGSATNSLLGRPGVAPTLGLTAVGAMLIAFLEPVLPLHMAGHHGATPTWIGVWFGVAALANILVYPLAGRAADRRGRMAVVATGAAIAAAALSAIGFVPTLWAVGLCLSLATIAAGLVLAPTTALIGELAESQDPPVYGAAYSLYNLAYASGLAAGPLLAGAGTTLLGFPTSAALFGLAMSLVALTAVLVARRRGPRPSR